MSNTSAQHIFERHLELLSTGRIKEWVDLFHADGVLEFPYGPPGYPKSILGKAALFEYMRNFPDIFDVTFTAPNYHPTSEPGLVIAEFKSDGIARSTQKSYMQTYISVVRIHDGLIMSYRDFWNPLVAMESLGGAAEFTSAFNEGSSI